MEKLSRYIIEHSSQEHEALKWIRKQTNLRTNHARMLSGPTQGALLTMLVRISSAKNILEVGTFTGYSTCCLGLGLPEGGHIDSLELNDELNDIIFGGWERAGLKHCISLHNGDALKTLEVLAGQIAEGFKPQYDLAFIDANKRQYRSYFDAVFPMIRPGGIILADNTLWNGKVLEEPLPSDSQTVELAAFNRMIASRKDLDAFILPLRDGLTFIRKK